MSAGASLKGKTEIMFAPFSWSGLGKAVALPRAVLKPPLKELISVLQSPRAALPPSIRGYISPHDETQITMDNGYSPYKYT